MRPILVRPHLVAAIILGVALYFASAAFIAGGVTRVLFGWDGGVILFLLLAMHFMKICNHDIMKRRALDHDEGGHLILLLTTLSAVASVGAMIAELSDAKGQAGMEWRVALAAATVVLSWLFVQVVFAMHYAHIYYLAEDSGAHHGGLEFGDKEEPDYWDFVHFSIVMGATSQTADIVIRSKQMRRIGTVHTLVAFGFNTAILATMINLAASLF